MALAPSKRVVGDMWCSQAVPFKIEKPALIRTFCVCVSSEFDAPRRSFGDQPLGASKSEVRDNGANGLDAIRPTSSVKRSLPAEWFTFTC